MTSKSSSFHHTIELVLAMQLVLLPPGVVPLAARIASIESTNAGRIIYANANGAEGASLVSYFPFADPGTGISETVMPDLSNSAIHARLNNGAQVIPFEGLLLDGSNDHATILDHSRLATLTATLTIAAFVRRASPGGTGTVFSFGDGVAISGTYYFGFVGGNRLAFTVRSVADYVSTVTLPDTNWHHVAARLSGAPQHALTLFVDGVQAGTYQNVTTALPSFAGAKFIGVRSATGGSPFGGNISQLRIYDRALTDAQIDMLSKGASCLSDGLTWLTAMPDLDCALTAAFEGDEIWIARGRYRPNTFQRAGFVTHKALGLHGGFLGNESSLTQRPGWGRGPFLAETHTVLDGDLLGNDLEPNGRRENTSQVLKATHPIEGSRIVVLHGENSGQYAAKCIYVDMAGGGICTESRAAFSEMAIGENHAGAEGGGLFIFGQANLDNIIVFDNSAIGSGGGLAGAVVTVTLTNSTLYSNTSLSSGGGAAMNGFIFVTRTRIFNNQAAYGGGLSMSNGLVDDSRIFINHATQAGGAMVVYRNVRSSRTNIFSNYARWGGAIEALGFVDQMPSLTMDNCLLADNVSSDHIGDDIRAFATTITLRNCTITSRRLSSQALRSSDSSITIINTIIANHAVGIQSDGGSALLIAPLFFSNGVNVTGTPATVSGAVYGDPRFVNSTSGNYKLGARSAAINMGVFVSLSGDFEGDVRPQLGAFDIGFDEAITNFAKVHLPLLHR